MSVSYPTLEAVLKDALFPEVDVGLRTGRHYSLDGDVREYEFLQVGEDWLQPFYERYGCRLVHGPESYYYLLADGGLLGQRRLSAAEMLAGQTLALMRMDPAFLSRNGQIPEDKLLAMLEHVVGAQRLFALLAPRSRGRDRETDARKIRDEIERALNGLQRLGFIRRLNEEDVRLILPRPAIMRFADPVRDEQDLAVALQRLIDCGEVAIESDSEDES